MKILLQETFRLRPKRAAPAPAPQHCILQCTNVSRCCVNIQQTINSVCFFRNFRNFLFIFIVVQTPRTCTVYRSTPIPSASRIPPTGTHTGCTTQVGDTYRLYNLGRRPIQAIQPRQETHTGYTTQVGDPYKYVDQEFITGCVISVYYTGRRS